MPNPTLFPLDGITIKLKDGQVYDLPRDRLDKALQYSSSYGFPELVDWIKVYQKEQHILPLQGASQVPDWDVCVTSGSQDALAKAFDMLLDEGDYILTEDPTYSGALAALHPFGCNLIGISADRHGMDPDALEAVLDKWDFKKHPLRVLYLIPTGQNPSGASLPLDRKKRIYKLAAKYDLIIMEDDPYYNLQLLEPGKTTAEAVPTFFSMDTDGRVLRFDSFSKIVSSGLRVGWVTGPRAMIEKIQLDMQGTELHASSVSQAVLLSVLEVWGKEGWERQVTQVQKEYSRRRDVLISYAEKYLVGLAEWSAPKAGMFLWMKLLGVEDSTELIKKKAVEELVLMVPGKSFSPNGGPSPYVRASFSTSSDEDMEKAMQRLGSLLKKEQKQ